jgi:hypothetical protein
VGRLPSRVTSMVLDDGRTGLEWIDAFLVKYCREHPPGTIRQLVREMLHLLQEDQFALDPAAGAEVVAALEAFAAPTRAGIPPPPPHHHRLRGWLRPGPRRVRVEPCTRPAARAGPRSGAPER